MPLKMNSRQLPEGWVEKKFNEIAFLSRGHNPPKSKFIRQPKEGYVRFYQIRDGKSDDYEVYVPDTPQLHKVEPDDILMVAYRHIGRVFRGANGAFNVALCKITNKECSIIDDDYLFYIIPTEFVRGELMKQAERSLIPSMSVKHLAEIKIPVPPLPEQKRIVAIVDHAFEGIDRAIANTKKNLTNARKLFESYLNTIFTQKGDGWGEKSLEKICSIKHGFAFKGEFFTNEENDYVVLTPGSFYESGGYRDQCQKTKYYTGESPKEYILNEGDFLFAMTEQAVGLLGSSLIVPESDKFLHNQRLGLVQVFADFAWHNDFFFHQFNTRRFRTAVQDSASGVKVRHTSPKKLGAIPVCFPSDVREQRRIADTLNVLCAETQQIEGIYRQKLAALNELKQAILQKAFTGELTVDTTQQATETVKEVIAA